MIHPFFVVGNDTMPCGVSDWHHAGAAKRQALANAFEILDIRSTSNVSGAGTCLRRLTFYHHLVMLTSIIGPGTSSTS